MLSNLEFQILYLSASNPSTVSSLDRIYDWSGEKTPVMVAKWFAIIECLIRKKLGLLPRDGGLYQDN